jgi:hypothetical protein
MLRSVQVFSGYAYYRDKKVVSDNCAFSCAASFIVGCKPFSSSPSTLFSASEEVHCKPIPYRNQRYFQHDQSRCNSPPALTII